MCSGLLGFMISLQSRLPLFWSIATWLEKGRKEQRSGEKSSGAVVRLASQVETSNTEPSAKVQKFE